MFKLHCINDEDIKKKKGHNQSNRFATVTCHSILFSGFFPMSEQMTLTLWHTHWNHQDGDQDEAFKQIGFCALSTSSSSLCCSRKRVLSTHLMTRCYGQLYIRMATTFVCKLFFPTKKRFGEDEKRERDMVKENLFS